MEHHLEALDGKVPVVAWRLWGEGGSLERHGEPGGYAEEYLMRPTRSLATRHASGYTYTTSENQYMDTCTPAVDENLDFDAWTTTCT